MAEFEDKKSALVCSDVSRLVIPGLAAAGGAGLGLLTGPGAAVASPALGATLAAGANALQQNYCDGEVSLVQVGVAGTLGALGGVGAAAARGAYAGAAASSVGASATGATLFNRLGSQSGRAEVLDTLIKEARASQLGFSSEELRHIFSKLDDIHRSGRQSGLSIINAVKSMRSTAQEVVREYEASTKLSSTVATHLDEEYASFVKYSQQMEKACDFVLKRVFGS